MVSDIENSRKGYRSKLEIIRDILLVASDAGEVGSRKTHIMYGANLSYRLLTRYLSEVLNAGLINKESPCYVITEKGKVFLESYKDYEMNETEIKKRTFYLKSGKKILEKLISP